MSQLSLLNLSFYWDCIFSSFTSYWWKIYLETPFLAISLTEIWRLRMTYNGYGYQHQKHSAEKLLVHCLSPELKTHTNCFPGLLLFSTTIISLTLDFKKKIFEHFVTIQREIIQHLSKSRCRLTNTIRCVLSGNKRKSV